MFFMNDEKLGQNLLILGGSEKLWWVITETSLNSEKNFILTVILEIPCQSLALETHFSPRSHFGFIVEGSFQSNNSDFS